MTKKLFHKSLLICTFLITFGCGKEGAQIDGEYAVDGELYRGIITKTVFSTDSAGLWLTPAEIAALPTSGAAFDRLKNVANGSFGTAAISDINNAHDVKVLAGAIYAARTGSTAMRDKVIAGLQSAMNSPINQHGDLILALSRCLQTYIISADLIGYRSTAFDSFIKKLLYYNYTGHSGGVGIYGTAVKSANNWGNHARASTIAAGLYLNDSAVINKMVEVQKEYIGLPVTTRTLKFTSTNWHPSSNKAGINRKGTTISGVSVDGALPEEMRRAGSFQNPPAKTDYAYEGMQGNIVSAVLLHRAGKLDIHSGDDAIKRAYAYLYRIGWKAEGDDTWQPYLANKFLGMGLAVGAANSGKNMGYTDYTHAK